MQFIGSGFGVNQIDQAIASQPNDSVARFICCGVDYVFKFDGKRVAENFYDPHKLNVVLALDLLRFVFVPRKSNWPIYT